MEYYGGYPGYGNYASSAYAMPMAQISPMSTFLSFLPMIILLIYVALMVIARWRIFTKAGEQGWKALIPFYSGYTLYKVSWESKYYFVQLIPTIIVFILVMIVSVTAAVFSIQAVNLRMSSAAVESAVAGFMAVFIVLYVLAIIFAQVAGIASIIQKYNLSKAYGHALAFTIGLVMLEPIFMMILGFGSSRYIGPGGVPNQTPPVQYPTGTIQ